MLTPGKAIAGQQRKNDGNRNHREDTEERCQAVELPVGIFDGNPGGVTYFVFSHFWVSS
jgi:D-serine dehydratase